MVKVHKLRLCFLDLAVFQKVANSAVPPVKVKLNSDDYLELYTLKVRPHGITLSSDWIPGSKATLIKTGEKVEVVEEDEHEVRIRESTGSEYPVKHSQLQQLSAGHFYTYRFDSITEEPVGLSGHILQLTCGTSAVKIEFQKVNDSWMISEVRKLWEDWHRNAKPSDKAAGPKPSTKPKGGNVSPLPPPVHAQGESRYEGDLDAETGQVIEHDHSVTHPAGTGRVKEHVSPQRTGRVTPAPQPKSPSKAKPTVHVPRAKAAPISQRKQYLSRNWKPSPVRAANGIRHDPSSAPSADAVFVPPIAANQEIVKGSRVRATDNGSSRWYRRSNFSKGDTGTVTKIDPKNPNRFKVKWTERTNAKPNWFSWYTTRSKIKFFDG